MKERMTLLKRIMAVTLSLALIFTMMPMIPGVVQKAHAESILQSAPTITVDENGIATWDEVTGATDYYWTLDSGSGTIASSENRSIDILQWLTENSKASGVYTLSIYARDSNMEAYSETAKATYAYGVEIIDKLVINFTTENATPCMKAYDLAKEIEAALEGKYISNGTENVSYCLNTYLQAYNGPNMTGGVTTITSTNTDYIDPDLYYYANIEVEAISGFDFKHEGTAFDQSSVATIINGSEMDGLTWHYYNEYHKLIDVNVPIEIDTSYKVHSIDITNNEVNVEKGSSLQFNSNVISYGDGYDAVTWSVEDAEAAGTTINESGLLTVDENESASSITVKVTSVKEPEKYDEVTLTVMDKIQIDSVTISPETTSILVRGSNVFNATVTGTDSHEVQWELTGNNSDKTVITPNEHKCTLTIGSDETAEELSLTVTSIKDPTKSATATITVVPLKIIENLYLNYTTENAKAGVLAYDLTKELRQALDGKNVSDGTNTVGYCLNVYLHSYTEPDMQGSRTQIEASTADLIDPKLYYYANFEIKSYAEYDFKHEGTVFDTSSLTTIINGTEVDGVADDSYNEYHKLIDIYVPIEITCTHKETTKTVENIVEATIDSDGHYEEVETCNACEEEVSRNTVDIAKISSIQLSETSFVYSGNANEPSVVIEDEDGNILEENIDYALEYNNNINVGPATVTIIFKDKYSGTITKDFTITGKPATGFTASLSSTLYTYDGNVKTPSVTVKDANGTVLEEGVNYTVTYPESRTNVGKYVVTVNYIGNYTGTAEVSYTIGPANPDTVKATLYGHDDVQFTWSAVPNAAGYKIYYKKASAASYTTIGRVTGTSYKLPDLADNTKYVFKVIAYQNVDGVNCYNAGKTCEVTTKVPTTGFKASLSSTLYTYDGNVKTPSVTVKDANGNTLVKDTDYTVTYPSGRKNIGQYTVTITYKGKYYGSTKLTYTIGPKNPTTVKGTLYGHDDVEFTWSKVDGATGYKIYYKKASAASYTTIGRVTGTSYKLPDLADNTKYVFKVIAYQNVDGVNCYNAGKTCEVTTKVPTTGFKASLSSTLYTYDGNVKTPSVTVKDANGNTLVKDTDYTATYPSSRTAIGKYTVTITYKGKYYGSTKLTYTIGPKNPSTVTAKLYGHDDVEFTWSKVSGAAGYKVYYKKSTDTSYTTVGTTTATSYKIPNLADGAKYTFKVITYQKVNGNNCYNAGKTCELTMLKKVPGIAVAKSSSSVKVSWTDIAGQSGYQISQATTKDGTTIVATYATTSGTYKNVSATAGKTYYYKVRAYKTEGDKKIYGPWSDVKSFKLS